ncbi:MAG: taurine catabolism dioxygenase TauD [Rhodopirellula sp.]|nr:taurine catabolism dioxygenase TauD [Rhodopirellula sp.]
MPKPVTGPAAWIGDELLERDDWTLTLVPQAIDELEAALADTLELELTEINSENFKLPTLGPMLVKIQHQLEFGSGATLIRGFPAERFSETQIERIFWGLTTYLGTAVSQSAKGERIFHVRDEGFRVGQPQARGPNTRKRLSFHTDRCDVIGFMCLQQAKSGGVNQLVSSVSVYNQILAERPDLLQELLAPYYYKRHNVDTGNELPYCQQPIFSFHQDVFASAYLRVLIDRAYQDNDVPPLTPLQLEALDFVDEVAARPQMHIEFRQEPGDIVLLNNWITYHRRTEFTDYEELARRRHLLRVWLAVPNSRALDEMFRANYGAVEAGAIRGGMNAQ